MLWPLASLAVLAGCGPETDSPPPDQRSAAEVLEAILEQCQGHRRGTFARAQIRLTRPETGAVATVSLDLPRRLRIDRPGGEHVVLADGVATTWVNGPPARILRDEEHEQVAKLGALLGMLVLQPLEGATDARRDAADRVSFANANGTSFTLTYDSEKDVPTRLTGPAGSVTFAQHLDTGRLQVPRIVELDDLGVRQIQIVETAFRFEDRFFAPPEAEEPAPDIVIGGSGGFGIPRVVEIDARSWLLIPDPGDWPGRLALYGAAGHRLGPAGYTNAGDPILLEEAGANWFVVQFRAAREDPGPVEAGDGEQLREIAAHREVVVLAEDGPWAERIESGRAAIERFLEKRGLVAAGASRLAVNLHGVPARENPPALRTTPLEVAVPIED